MSLLRFDAPSSLLSFAVAFFAGAPVGCGGQSALPDMSNARAGGDAGMPADTTPLVKVPIGSSPVRGPNDAWVTMIEFGDFQCPFCGEEEPVVEALLKEFPADLRLVFKNFPLTNLHPFAMGAAVAAECAGEQGDFWPMHDVLYANQTALQSQNLPGYAKTAGVDVPTWQACLSTQPPVDAVDADVALGDSIGVPGTPTFVVNGEKIVGAVPQSQLETAIEAKRAEAEASGVPSSEYYQKVVLGSP